MEHRVEFDFDIRFSNGGGLVGEGFRLDIEGEDVSDAWVADAIVRDLPVLMVESVTITQRRIIAEAHKRPPAAGEARDQCRPDSRRTTRRIDLSHRIEDGMVTYRGLPAPLICRPPQPRGVARRSYAPGHRVPDRPDRRWSRTRARTSTRPFHRFADGTDLAGLGLGSHSPTCPAIVIRRPESPDGRSTADLVAGTRRTGRRGRGRPGPHRLGRATGARTPTSRDTPS